MKTEEHEHDYHLLEGVEEEEQESKWRKPLIRLIGFFMILLMLSYLIPLGRIGSIIESKEIDQNYYIQLKEGKSILFDKAVYEEVRDAYIASAHEIKVCLKGDRQGSTYYITDLYYPTIIDSGFDHVVSEPCDRDTIISLHSHPETWCIFSTQDIRSYEQLITYNEDAFIGLICDIDKFNFHGY